MKTACSAQCAQCPFRSTSLAGWLGGYDGPSAIFSSLWRQEPFFCHTATDYSRKDWLARSMEHGKLCTGALIFVGRQAYFPTSSDPDVTRALAWAMAQYAANPARFDVLEPKAFIAHHSTGESAEFFRTQRLAETG